MKLKTAIFLFAVCVPACAQIDAVKVNKNTNVLVTPSAAAFRSANSIQQQNATLDTLIANTGTVNIGGVTLNIAAGTTFGTTARAIIGTASGSNATVTWPTGILTIPNLAVGAFASWPTITTGGPAVDASSSFASTTTAALLRSIASSSSYSGPLIQAIHNGNARFTISHLGDLTFAGTGTGNGSGFTALNASNLASGTVAAARLGSGTANGDTLLHGNNTFSAVNLSDGDVTGVLPLDKGGTGGGNGLALLIAAFSNEADVVAAGTTDLGTAAAIAGTGLLRITGTTGITSLGSGHMGFAITRFADTLPLTNGANLILPLGENLTTAAGDVIMWANPSSGVWRAINVHRATLAGTLRDAGTMAAYSGQVGRSDTDGTAPAENMSFAVKAGENWSFEVYAPWEDGAGGITVHYTMNFTGSGTMAWDHWHYEGANDLIARGHHEGSPDQGPYNADNDNTTLIKGSVRATTAGTISFDWGPGTVSGDSISIRDGAYMILHRLP